MGVTNMKSIITVSIFLILNGLVQGQKLEVKVQSKESLLAQMYDQINLSCSSNYNTSNYNNTFEDCNWFFTDSNAEGAYQNYKMLYNNEYNQAMSWDQYKDLFFTRKFSCLPGLELQDNMICGNGSNVCSLSIQQFEGYKHEGNWTCQLKVNSNWINATNFVKVIDNTKKTDMISMYMSKFVNQITSSIETFISMMEEIDIGNELDDIL